MRMFAGMITVVLAGSTAVAGATATAATPNSHVRSHHRCALPRFGPGTDYRPRIDPSRFGPNVDNAWFPLRPGTTYVYAGSEDGAALVDVFAPSRRPRLIDGVRTRVVHDRLLTDGVLTERTTDYYAQDVCGNVWYFGEDTAELDEHGKVTSRDGSWRSGRAGAQPGVFMPARPRLGRTFRQEWSLGVAEDQFTAVSRHARADVPYGHFTCALRTTEVTALEPGVVDKKLYARGVGQVVEQTVKGGTEKLLLVDVLR